MANYSVFVLLILIGIVLIKSMAWSTGVPRSYGQLKRPIEDLLQRGYHRGFLVVTHKDSELFVQFRKYVEAAENYGIELAFPCVDWSKSYFEKLRLYCLQNEIRFDTRVESFRDDEVRFLYVDLKKDVAAAYNLLSVILFHLFEIDQRDKFYVLLSGASIKDELVTRK